MIYKKRISVSFKPIVVGIMKNNKKCTVSGWIEAGTSLVLVKQKKSIFHKPHTSNLYFSNY